MLLCNSAELRRVPTEHKTSRQMAAGDSPSPVSAPHKPPLFKTSMSTNSEARGLAREPGFTRPFLTCHA